jgi:protein required for attachment to host cells
MYINFPETEDTSMITTWIVAANNSRARIFSFQGNMASAREIRNFLHPEGRMRRQDLTSDRPGRTYDSKGKGRHAKQERVDPAKQEMIKYTGRIAGFIENGRQQGIFDRLILIASPALLGLLRKKLSKMTRGLITREVRKNLATGSFVEIRRHLQ